jgi:hypothetical protein
MSQPSDRALYLFDDLRSPERLDENTFECGFAWWCQCMMLVPALDAESVVNADEASALADGIKRNLPNLGWARAFAEFLRGGGFSIVSLGNVEL